MPNEHANNIPRQTLLHSNPSHDMNQSGRGHAGFQPHTIYEFQAVVLSLCFDLRSPTPTLERKKEHVKLVL